MGKSKSKHKEPRSERRTRINEGEERRKMRESILKSMQEEILTVFHERAQSPDGAVLVNDNITNLPSTSSKGRLDKERKAMWHQHASTQEPSSSDTLKDDRIESRKRKRRNRIMTGQEGHHHGSKATVSQHVQSAHSHSYKASSEKTSSRCQKEDIGGHITRNRLTRGVGLFNPGKKSKTIYREPPPVPESVEKEVEKTLKQILTKEDESHHHFDVDKMNATSATDAGTADSHSRASCVTPGSDSHDQSGEVNTYVHSLSSSSRHRSPTHLVNSDSSVELDKPFPKLMTAEQAAPYKKIANNMLEYLSAKSKNTFKDRDLLAETCKELQKLLHQNKCSDKQPGHKSSTCGSCVRQAPVNSPHVIPGVSSTAISQQSSHSLEMPVHEEYLSTSDNQHHMLKSHRFTYPTLSVPESVPTVFHSLQPSQFGVQSQPVLPSSHNGLATDLSTFSLPLAKEPSVINNLRWVKAPHQSQHKVDLGGSGDRGNRLPPLSAHSNILDRFSTLIPSRSKMELGWRKETFGEVVNGSKQSERKDECKACDLELNQLIDHPPGFQINDSAIQLLQCNNFISRVSTLCGETDCSPQNEAPQISLHDQYYLQSARACPTQRYGRLAADPKEGFPNCALKNGEQNTFLRKVMGQSSMFNLKPHCDDSFHAQKQQFKDAKNDITRERMLPNPSHSDLLDDLDTSPFDNIQHQVWDQHHSGHQDDDDDDSFLQGKDDFSHDWNQSVGILTPLKKPSFNTPSPPQKMTPHKWF